MTDDHESLALTTPSGEIEMSENELKPCPFCGGAPYGTPSGHPGWVIRCGNCSARTVSDYGRHQAEEEWNRRSHSITHLPQSITHVLPFHDETMAALNSLTIRKDR